jgi:CTP-dependent riboflavin kinase
MLLNRGARLRCFRHTFEEIREVLESCKQNVLAGKVFDRWGTLEYFINQKYGASDIVLLINKLKDSLGNFNISIKEAPPYKPEYCLSEDSL